jgi:hypothetical protein
VNDILLNWSSILVFPVIKLVANAHSRLSLKFIQNEVISHMWTLGCSLPMPELKDLHIKFGTQKNSKGLECISVIEHLPSMHEALGSNLALPKRKK